MSKMVGQFWTSSEGQDLVEYSLMLAFIVLAGAAAVIGMGGSISVLWTVVNNRLASQASGS